MNNLTMKSLLVFALASIIFSAPVKAATMVDCRDVGNKMSWHVSMDSDFLLGSYFDNDHETALGRTSIDHYDVYSQPVYTFEGQDGGSKIKFLYTAENKTGVLRVNVGSRDEFNVKFSCHAVQSYIEWAEVKKALKDASKNGGSTRYD